MSSVPYVFNKDKIWVWILNREPREVVAYACGDCNEETCQILCDCISSTYRKAMVFTIVGKRIKLLFRMSSIFLSAKEQEKHPILSAGMMPCGSARA